MNIPVAPNISRRTQLQEGLCRASSSIRYEYFIILSKTFDPLWCLNIFQVNLEDKLALLADLEAWLADLEDGGRIGAAGRSGGWRTDRRRWRIWRMEDGSAPLANMEGGSAWVSRGWLATQTRKKKVGTKEGLAGLPCAPGAF